MSLNLDLTVLEKNKLWLRWARVEKPGDGTVILHKAEFYGPVTKDYVKLPESDFIKLDFTNHFLLKIADYYTVELAWDKIVSQEEGLVKFNKLTLKDENVGLLNKIKPTDKLLVDCSDHTTEQRQSGYYKMAYPAMLYNEQNEIYDFSKK